MNRLATLRDVIGVAHAPSHAAFGALAEWISNYRKEVCGEGAANSTRGRVHSP